MKLYGKNFIKLNCLFILISICFSFNVFAQTFGSISATDIYYTAKSIDDLVVIMHDLETRFNKKPISYNIKPENVFEMALEVVEKFELLHEKVLGHNHFNIPEQLDKISNSDIYNVLIDLKVHIIETHNELMPSIMPFEERIVKNFSDTFQMLRQLSFHIDEIAMQKNIKTIWDTPAQVYDSVITEILPAVYEIADAAGLTYEKFVFPDQPLKDVLPRNVYSLLYYTYINFTKFYAEKKDYQPVIFEQMNDCDEISPSDVFTISQIISSELSNIKSRKSLDDNIKKQYIKWKANKDKIVPGDVFRLVQHNFIISCKILKQNS